MQTEEVPLHTLKLGTVFYLDLYTRKVRGVLIAINRGSCTVAVESQKPPRTIRTADGRESAPIKQPDVIQHWDLESQVLPTTEAQDVQKWIAKLKGETKMNDATAVAPAKEKKVRTPKVKAAKKAAEPKKLLTTRYSVTAKAVSEKLGYENEEKMTHNAVIYRFVKATDTPVTFAEITEGIGRKAFGSESKEVDNIFRWHISDLMKKGLLKSTEKREEVEAA